MYGNNTSDKFTTDHFHFHEQKTMTTTTIADTAALIKWRKKKYKVEKRQNYFYASAWKSTFFQIQRMAYTRKKKKKLK